MTEKKTLMPKREGQPNKCLECRGNGWTPQRIPRLGKGVFEIDCPSCEGSGKCAA